MRELKAFHWYWIGLGSIGALTGFLSVLSASPVVVTAIPIILSAIVGMSAFILGKANLAESQLKVKYWGVGFCAFSVSTVIASTLTLYTTRYVLKDEKTDIVLNGISHGYATELVALKTKLRILGASDSEISEIIDSAKKTLRVSIPVPDGRQFDRYIERFVSIAEKLERVLSEVNELDDESRNKLGLDSLKATLSGTVPLLKQWQNDAFTRVAIDRNGVKLYLNSISALVNRAIGEQDAIDVEKATLLKGSPELIAHLLETKASLKYQIQVPNIPPSVLNPSLDVDALTRLLMSDAGSLNSELKMNSYGNEWIASVDLKDDSMFAPSRNLIQELIE